MMAKRILARTLLFLCGSLIVFWILKGFHNFYLQGLDRSGLRTNVLKDLYRWPNLTSKQVLNLRVAHTEFNSPKSSYIFHPKHKPPGTVRIGFFEGSFIAGDEVSYGRDLPSVLQALFRKAGYSNVEIINFAVDSFGTHQSFLMWDDLGRQYDLDYTVFLPFSFHYDWDTSFTGYPLGYCDLHARYILDGPGVKLIPVLGESREQGCSLYRRLIPPWTYLRYDRRPPGFISALLPAERTISNPFYYTNLTKKAEALETYRLLFSRLAAEAKHPIVICRDEEICGLNQDVSRAVTFYKFEMEERFLRGKSSLYLAPYWHWSALGTEVLAQELFSFFTGQKNPAYKILTLLPVLQRKKESPAQVPPLWIYDDVKVGIAGKTLAQLVIDRDPRKIHGLAVDLDLKHRVTSLLWAHGPEGLKFYPSLFSLLDEEPIYASFLVDHRRYRLPIGRVDASSTSVGRLSLNCAQPVRAPFPAEVSVQCAGPYLDRLMVEAKGGIEDLRIETGETDKIFMIGKIAGSPHFFDLEPVYSDVAYLRASEGTATLGDGHFKNEGTLDLIAKIGDRISALIPITSYKIVRERYEGPKSIYGATIKK